MQKRDRCRQVLNRRKLGGHRLLSFHRQMGWSVTRNDATEWSYRRTNLAGVKYADRFAFEHTEPHPVRQDIIAVKQSLAING